MCLESPWASAVFTVRNNKRLPVIKKALAAFVCALVSFVIAAESATSIHSSSILACFSCSWTRERFDACDQLNRIAGSGLALGIHRNRPVRNKFEIAPRKNPHRQPMAMGESLINRRVVFVHIFQNLFDAGEEAAANEAVQDAVVERQT